MAFSQRTLSLALATIALASTAACADVGKGSSSGDGAAVPSSDQDKIVCQSIRTAMERDKKAGNKDAVLAGAEGAKSVKGCDVSDLVPAAGGTAKPTPSS